MKRILSVLLLAMMFAFVLSFGVSAQSCGSLTISQLTCDYPNGSPQPCSCSQNSCQFSLYDGQGGNLYATVPSGLWNGNMAVYENGQQVATVSPHGTVRLPLSFTSPASGSGTTATTWQIRGIDQSQTTNCWDATITANVNYQPSPQQLAENAINSAISTINQASSQQNSVQATVVQAGQSCTTAQTSMSSGNSMLSSANTQLSTAQSEYGSTNYQAAQTDASAAQISASQALNNYQAAASAASYCIQQAAASQAAAQGQQPVYPPSGAVGFATATPYPSDQNSNGSGNLLLLGIVFVAILGGYFLWSSNRKQKVANRKHHEKHRK